MQRIGVLYNPLSTESTQASIRLANWLQAEGLQVWRGVSHEGRTEPQPLSSLDLLIALGGDGTMLRAARLAQPLGVPILGVAMGRLSFMAELEPDELLWGLRALLRGEGWRDERTMVQATLVRHGVPVGTYTALNEVLLARRDVSRVVQVDVAVYDAHLTTYHADGVLIATATGSTAYALAAGGPLIDPRSRALLLVPVAAHLTNMSSLVLHEDAMVTLRLHSRHGAILSIDGRENLAVEEDDFVRVRRSPDVCVFARVHPPQHFYAGLTERLRRT